MIRGGDEERKRCRYSVFQAIVETAVRLGGGADKRVVREEVEGDIEGVWA